MNLNSTRYIVRSWNGMVLTQTSNRAYAVEMADGYDGTVFVRDTGAVEYASRDRGQHVDGSIVI